jgi:hypothetical protein
MSSNPPHGPPDGNFSPYSHSPHPKAYSCLTSESPPDTSSIIITRKFEHNTYRPKSVSQSVLSKLNSITQNLDQIALQNISFSEGQKLLDQINQNYTKMANFEEDQWKVEILKKMTLKKPQKTMSTQTDEERKLTTVEQAMEDAKAEVIKDMYGVKKREYLEQQTETNPIDFPEPPLT